MNITWCKTHAEVDDGAATVFCSTVSEKPASVIALPTGHTPRGMYAEIVRRAKSGSARLDKAQFFNLDDYVGVSEYHPMSYAAYMKHHLIEPADLPLDHVRLLEGDTSDLVKECADYDACIAKAGGLDLAILGLGVNGHIAFNEPGIPWTLKTHVIELDEVTRSTHRAQVNGAWEIPQRGITMGIDTIRAARKIILIVTGKSKSTALASLLNNVPDINWPVTSLIGHSDLHIFADHELNPKVSLQ